MAKQKKPGSIEAILSSKVVPKPQLTQGEKAAFARELEKLIENFRKHKAENLAKVLKPVVDVSKMVQRIGKDFNVAQTLEAIRNKPPVNAVEVRALPMPLILPTEYFLTIVIPPPYDFGVPENEVVTDVERPDGTLDVFKSSSTLAIPSTGDLSLGVAVGEFGNNIYPAAGEGEFGEVKTVGAYITHIVYFPGPIDKLTSITVTIDIEVGHPYYSSVTAYLSEGSLSSASGGLVGIEGSVYLSLWGTPSVGGTRTKEAQFLSQWRTALTVGSVGTYTKSFSVSETLLLLPGASLILINVLADLWAYRGGMADPQGGFAGVDFRSAGTQGIIPLQPSGGPIHISAIRMTFRHVHDSVAQYPWDLSL